MDICLPHVSSMAQGPISLPSPCTLLPPPWTRPPSGFLIFPTIQLQFLLYISCRVVLPVSDCCPVCWLRCGWYLVENMKKDELRVLLHCHLPKLLQRKQSFKKFFFQVYTGRVHGLPQNICFKMTNIRMYPSEMMGFQKKKNPLST